MDTIKYISGSAETLTIRPRQPDGTPPDMTDLQARLVLTTEAGSVVLEGLATTVEKAGVTSPCHDFPLALLTLVPGPYRTEVQYDDGTGWSTERAFVLNVLRGADALALGSVSPAATDTNYVAIFEAART